MPSPLKDHSKAALQLEKQLDDVTGNFLRGDFAIAKQQFLRIDPADKPAYFVGRVMLAYLAQRLGDVESMMKYCEELAQLKPDEKAYWLGKRALAESIL